MPTIVKKIPFTRGLYQFLIREGYTHIQLRGIEPRLERDFTNHNSDDYILVPWKKGLTNFEESDLFIEDVHSTDVTDMLDVEFGIHFLVEMPVDLITAFEKELR